ncbi:MAG: LysE family translocator [Hyphomicrobiales bacterium]|nr:MAG: LysE family translocator [Hyphomicrobiales bacterium]
MMAIPYDVLIVGWLAFAAVAIAPGPNLLAVASTALGAGRSQALFVAAGVATGSFIWAFSSILGFTYAFAAYPWLGDVLRIAGGAYLIYIGIKAIRAGLKGGVASARAGHRSSTRLQSWLRGLGVVALNPKALLFWTAMAALVVTPGINAASALLFATGTTLISFSVYAAYATIFSLPALRTRYDRFADRLEMAFGALFCLFGARLLAGR